MSVFCVSQVYAQFDSTFIDEKPTLLGVGFDYGFLIKHSKSIQKLKDSYPFAIKLDWSKLLLTKKAWNFCNCFPRTGASISYWNWDNPSVLGSGFVILSYVEPYFYTQGNTNLFFNIGIGGAIQTRPYDEKTNPTNLSYSTTINFPIVLGIGLNYKFYNVYNLSLAAKYNHISNGGFQTPNKGLNFPTVSIGINRSLKAINFPNPLKSEERNLAENKTRLSIVHFSGWSNASVGDKDKHYVTGIKANYSRWLKGKFAMSFGSEWILDFSRKKQIEINNRNEDFQTAAVLIGYEFWLGKVTFSQQLGVYYFNEFRQMGDVYQRYGLTYTFSRNMFAGFNLKTHGHVADFFDLRIGYILNYKQ